MKWGRSMAPFKQMQKDEVSLIKIDGTRINNIRSHVGSKKIFISDASLPIEEGDKILRTLPNGLEEYYVVIDRGYLAGLPPNLPAHYQVKVRKETNEDDVKNSSTVYNLTGNNPRVNIHSQDHSVNVLVNETNVFEELKVTIDKHVSNTDEKTKLLRQVDELKSTKNTTKFTETYKEFITLASNHMTLIAPFIPALTALLN